MLASGNQPVFARAPNPRLRDPAVRRDQDGVPAEEVIRVLHYKDNRFAKAISAPAPTVERRDNLYIRPKEGQGIGAQKGRNIHRVI